MSRKFIDIGLLAERAMREHGLDPDFTGEVLAQVERMPETPTEQDSSIRDMRDKTWVSIDNDDSRDLDQLSVAEEQPDGSAWVYVAIADVDSRVKKGSPTDLRAQYNTTSVYTPTRVFPMLPERLSTDLTSLNPHEDRLAIVIAYTVLEDGTLGAWDVYRAWVHNKAKLAYNSVSAWLDGKGPMPEAMAAAEGAAEQVRLQDKIVQRLRDLREERGALDLETIEPKAKVQDGIVLDLLDIPQNRAQKLIEDIMIAANGVSTQYLEQRNYPTLRRIVRSPERWDRIERLAAEFGYKLPPDPDSRPLADFLRIRRKADPLRFPDLSLSIVKMMGAGEYAVQMPDEEPIGHFGLAVRDYSHSTAPNRRYPDLITQRLLKSAMQQKRSPYVREELAELAEHCTLQEDAANKVERQMRKSAAALLLRDKIGERFDAIVTGVSSKGTWVRTLHPPVEGKLISSHADLDVGDRVTVRLDGVDIERGFIDFVA